MRLDGMEVRDMGIQLMPIWNIPAIRMLTFSRTNVVCDPGSAVGLATASETTASSDGSVGCCLSPLRSASLPISVTAVTTLRQERNELGAKNSRANHQGYLVYD